MKELIVFDLDGTIAESKSSLDDEMSTLLRDLLSIVKVAVGFDTLGFSTCQSRRSAIVRQIKINDLFAPYNGKMLSSSQLLN
jgi:hydroxymethylpyrimidine pyrophosphatase-like HAD family hydrolase